MLCVVCWVGVVGADDELCGDAHEELEELRIRQLGTDGIEGPSGNSSDDGIWAPPHERENCCKGADDTHTQRWLLPWPAGFLEQPWIHSSNRRDIDTCMSGLRGLFILTPM